MKWAELGPTLISAVAVHSRCLAPWFVMQPASGMGFLASRTRSPPRLAPDSVLAHALVFGIAFTYWHDAGLCWLGAA